MNEVQERLTALREYEIMDTPPEQAFDDLSRLTSFICNTPIALVTLLDNRRQWFKSKVGLSGYETPLEISFCQYTIQQPDPFIVADATLDERFAANPFVTGDPHVRFYAGAPLITPAGVPLGTLCAIDRVPRELSADQIDALSALARQVVRMLELRKTVKALSVALAEKEAARREVNTLQGLLPMCAWCHKVRDDQSFWCDVEHYITHHSDKKISHGICPACAEKLQMELH